MSDVKKHWENVVFLLTLRQLVHSLVHQVLVPFGFFCAKNPFFCVVQFIVLSCWLCCCCATAFLPCKLLPKLTEDICLLHLDPQFCNKIHSPYYVFFFSAKLSASQYLLKSPISFDVQFVSIFWIGKCTARVTHLLATSLYPKMPLQRRLVHPFTHNGPLPCKELPTPLGAIEDTMPCSRTLQMCGKLELGYEPPSLWSSICDLLYQLSSFIALFLLEAPCVMCH